MPIGCWICPGSTYGNRTALRSSTVAFRIVWRDTFRHRLCHAAMRDRDTLHHGLLVSHVAEVASGFDREEYNEACFPSLWSRCFE